MNVNSRKLIKLATNLRRFRKTSGYTQEQLASKIRLTPTYVGFIEQGQRNPSLKTLDKISRVLGIKLSDLLN